MDNVVKVKNETIINQYLTNKKLFKIVNGDAEVNKKIKEMLLWLEYDVNINYIEDDNENNTMLHIAVIRGELDIVKLLLQRGASTTHKNVDNKTALDLARSLNIKDKQEIIDIIQTYNRRSSVQAAQTTEQSTGFENLLVEPLLRDHMKCKHIKQPQCNEKLYNPLLYTKRSGTSGIGGQLYETKLLSLFLLRGLNNKNINSFYLGTNVEGIGAFDDILLKYEVEGINTPRILFIQAKHKDEPEQSKITMQDLFKDSGDFCLHKYYDSYIRIRNKFSNSNGDIIFDHNFKNVHCSFIIFTPAMESIGENKKYIVDNPDETIFHIHTSNLGKVFKLNYCQNDEEVLLETALEMRAQLLGKTLMKFLFKDNYSNILTDDLMKAYHVFLGQHVIKVISEAQLIHPYLNGKFRSTFLNSENKLLRILKETIYKEFCLKYNKCSMDQIANLVYAFSFKLPLNFGNVNFVIGGSNKKIERRLKHICSKIRKMLDYGESIDSSFINIDNSMIGPDLILQESDLDMHRLGGLVGNLFVLDENTFTFKFNEYIELLPPLVIKVFELLKKEYPEGKDFTKYRFLINHYKFPKLLFCRNMDEVRSVKDFLDSVFFYTNQACESEVEKLLKHEIDICYGLNSIKGNLLSRMKGETIYLKVHDKIQKWWKQPHISPYLDKNCIFYDKANGELLSNSLLHTLQSLFIKKLTGYGVQFRQFDCQFDILSENYEGILNIVTSDIILTSIKLIQFMQRNTISTSHIFVNLDFVISQNCFDEVFSELREIKKKVIFITCENINLCDKILKLSDTLQGLLVIVTKHELREKVLLNLHPRKYTQIFDQRTAFIDLAVESRIRILNETEVLFQGSFTLLKTLIKNKLDVIDSASLYAILNKQNIRIGRNFTKAKSEEFEDCYVARSISRFITLKTECDDKFFIIDNIENSQVIPNGNKDTVVISDKIEDFLLYCEKYKDKNIHWFIKDNKNFIWRKSAGSLNILADYVHKSCCQSYKYKPRSLLDLDEKVVIISAEPGMGKSTLMTHLCIQTKLRYPATWIMRINCLNYKNLFSYWQDNNTVIDLKETIKFLYMSNDFLLLKEKTPSGNFWDTFRYNFNINISPDGDISIDVKDQEFVGLPYLEVGIFNLLYNNGDIAIVFDGFDEISPDYINEVTKILEILKHSRVCRLWITTRPYNILPNLEQIMGTFAFTLEKLSSDDQHELLEKLWGKSLGEKRNDRLKLYVQNFFESISRVIFDKGKDFTSIPLHIYMIAEIYQTFFKDYYDPYISRLSEEFMRHVQALNSLTLYERFIKKKFYEIHFGEKKPYIYDRDPDLKKMIEMQRREFNEVHKKLSAYAIFDRTVVGLFSKQVTKDIHEALERVKQGEERTGIIDRVVDNEPIFVHLSYAEYFAAEYLCDKLKSEECSVEVWIYLFNFIFLDKRLVRLFFNYKLLKDQELFKLSEIFKYKKEITEVLLRQRNLNSLNTALFENLGTNALFLLQCIKDAIDTDNLDDFLKYTLERKKISCSFCSMVNGRHSTVLKLVVECVKKIDKHRLIELFRCGDVPLFNVLGLSLSFCGFHEDRLLLDYLLLSVDDTDMALEIFTMPSNMGLLKNTIVHVLVMNKLDLRLLAEYLLKFNKQQRMNVFSTCNVDGKLAAHYAAENGDQNFFVVLSELLDREQLKRICATCDNIGRTPIDYFKSNIVDYNQFQQQIKDLLEDR